MPNEDGPACGSRGDYWVLVLPILVAVGPVAYLWSANAGIVEPSNVLMPAISTILCSGCAVAILWGFTRDASRSGVTIAVALLPVLTFGYQLDALPTVVPSIIRWPLLIANMAVAASLIGLTWRRDVRMVSRFSTGVAALFIVSTVPGMLSGLSWNDARAPEGGDLKGNGPDIYYIVLDAYGRADVLADLYGHDNEPFLDGLRQHGFFVADESYSNYSMTRLSLPSTLNMRYLPEDAVDESALPRLDAMLEDAAAIRVLQRNGYRYVHFESDWWGTGNAPLADVTYPRRGFGSEFELVFWRSTLPGRFLPSPSRHEVVLDTLARLTEVPQIDEPTFTFVHLLVPHPPFMFDRSGTILEYDPNLLGNFDGPDAYVEQLEFVNRQVTHVVERLVMESAQQPIIILQGDHGPALTLTTQGGDSTTAYWERMGILNAYLVPRTLANDLYRSISPVNTFRVILRGLFGEDLPPLPDRALFNWYGPDDSPAVADEYLELRDVTDLLP